MNDEFDHSTHPRFEDVMDKRVKDPPDQNNRPGGVWVQLTNPSPREGQTADGGTVELSVEIIHRSAQPLHSPCTVPASNMDCSRRVGPVHLGVCVAARSRRTGRPGLGGRTRTSTRTL